VDPKPSMRRREKRRVDSPAVSSSPSSCYVGSDVEEDGVPQKANVSWVHEDVRLRFSIYSPTPKAGPTNYEVQSKKF
jgi:hypothetical protein